MSETILTNATLVLEGETLSGSIVFDAAGIRAVDGGRSSAPGAIDVEGDYVAPGLVEMHTDNMEKHFMPRPGVVWPNALAAAMAHDAQMAAAGVTTVYDSIVCGTVFSSNDHRPEMLPKMVDAVARGVARGAFRVDHKIHLRCELSADEFEAEIQAYARHPMVELISLMDHTPGQRQFKSREHLKTYSVGLGKTSGEHDREVEERSASGPVNVERNWPLAVDLFRPRGIPIATHDDTTEQDIMMARKSGAVIAEFPTTVEAAEAARRHGLGTIAGAPNLVRGQSHFGGVSALDLARRGLLDGLSSDYVPSSLLQAVLRLKAEPGFDLPRAMAMVTWRVADLLGLKDRGRLRAGQRADIARFRDDDGTPVVRGLWSAGERAF